MQNLFHLKRPVAVFWEAVKMYGMKKRLTADLDEQTIKKLKRTGFWWSEEEPHLPHPKDFVDKEWDPEEREKVIAYLESSYYMPYRYFGMSWCRMGCRGEPEDIGEQDLTDGTWVFPEGLVHYVRHHYVKPEKAFLEHVRKNNYKVPPLPAEER